jgi:hypothetical protein
MLVVSPRSSISSALPTSLSQSCSSLGMHLPCLTSQTVFSGQQWMWSEQQTALARGQQAHSPCCSAWQQVWPDEQVSSGHSSSALSASTELEEDELDDDELDEDELDEDELEETRSSASSALPTNLSQSFSSLGMHLPCLTSQTVFSGQQWMWSEQQTALARGQQAHSPCCSAWQQVWPDEQVSSGHSSSALSASTELEDDELEDDELDEDELDEDELEETVSRSSASSALPTNLSQICSSLGMHLPCLTSQTVFSGQQWM